MELPIYRKELLEQAEQRKTYIWRVAFGLLIFISFLIRMQQIQEVTMFWGYGVTALRFTVGFVSLAIFLTQPAFAAGAITEEKERNALVLIHLSNISIRGIIFQKFAASVFPVLLMILMTAPVVAMCYQLGGVSSTDLVVAIVYLLALSSAIGACAIYHSMRYATTHLALMTTYKRIAPAGFVLTTFILFNRSAISWLPLASMLLLAAIAICLKYAIEAFERYAFPPPGLDDEDDRAGDFFGPTRKVFRRRKLPQLSSITWRELNYYRKHKYGIDGVANGLSILLLFTLLPLVGMATIGLRDTNVHVFVAYVTGLIWIGTVAWIVTYAVNCIARERHQQTLEILLATPLSGANIIQQKVTAGCTLFKTFLRPLYCLYFIKAMMLILGIVGDLFVQERNTGVIVPPTQAEIMAERLLAGIDLFYGLGIFALSVWLVPRLLLWVSILAAINIRNRLRAMLSMLMTLIALQIQPLPWLQPVYYLNGGYPAQTWIEKPMESCVITAGWIVLTCAYFCVRRTCLSQSRDGLTRRN